MLILQRKKPKHINAHWFAQINGGINIQIIQLQNQRFWPLLPPISQIAVFGIHMKDMMSITVTEAKILLLLFWAAVKGG